MPVVVPGVLGDLRFAQSRFKPPAAIGPGAGAWEDRLSGFVGHSFLLLLERIQRHGVQGDVARRTIFGFRQADYLPLEVHLRPFQRELLSPAHSGVHAENERGRLLGLSR